MNIVRRACWFIAAAALAAATFNAGSAAPGPGARFNQVRERAAALYEHRNQRPAAPLPVENPLRPAGALSAAPPAGADTGPRARPAPTELALLQQAVATLRVSGTFEKDGDSYLVINSKPCRIGDVVQAAVGGETVYLRVRAIARENVTLALNETEITLPYGIGTPR
jgi:hypothetical protein